MKSDIYNLSQWNQCTKYDLCDNRLMQTEFWAIKSIFWQSCRLIVVKKTRARRSQMRQSESFEQHKFIFVYSALNFRVTGSCYTHHQDTLASAGWCQNLAFPFSNFVCEQRGQGLDILETWLRLQSTEFGIFRDLWKCELFLCKMGTKMRYKLYN